MALWFYLNRSIEVKLSLTFQEKVATIATKPKKGGRYVYGWYKRIEEPLNPLSQTN